MALHQNKLPLSLMFAVSKGQIFFSTYGCRKWHGSDFTSFLAKEIIYSSKNIYKYL